MKYILRRMDIGSLISLGSPHRLSISESMKPTKHFCRYPPKTYGRQLPNPAMQPRPQKPSRRWFPEEIQGAMPHFLDAERRVQEGLAETATETIR